MKPLEQEIIHHAAPTLASIKAANLLSYRYEDIGSFHREVREMQQVLNPKGIDIEILSENDGRALVYIYRRRDLELILSLEESQDILFRFGYFHMDTESAIDHLRTRIWNEDGFPHEIGLFLGYPLCDVEGFLKDRGRGCSCAGLWKSYCDPEEARKEFWKLEHCMTVYNRVYCDGRSLEMMTVAS